MIKTRSPKSFGAKKGGAVLQPRFSELSIHCAIVDLLRKTKRLGVVFWHTPNGEKRDAKTGAKLYRMGVLPGVSDLIIMDGRRFFAMEVKAPGERPTPEQREFLDTFAMSGGAVAVVDSVLQAERYFIEWNITRIATR